MKSERFKKKKVSSFSMIFLAVLILTSTPLRADESNDEPKASAYVDVLSQYVWRGYALSRSSAVLQPSLTVGYSGLALNIWGNFDSDEQNPALRRNKAKWNETDLTLGTLWELYEGLSGTVGGIYYALDSVDDSFEVYAGLSYAFPWLNVAVTGYREVSHYPGWWIQMDLSRNIELPWHRMSADLGATFIYQISEDNSAYPDPNDPAAAFAGPLTGGLNAALNIPLSKFVTVSPKIGFWFPLSSDGRKEIETLSWDGLANHVYGGLRISAAF